MEDVKFGYSAKDIIREQRVSKEDVEKIKIFVKTQDLPSLTDEQLIAFLLSCENDQEATRNKILAHYSLKKNYPRAFEDRNVEKDDLQHQLKTTRICVFPKRTQDGCVIIYFSLYDTTYWNYNMRPAMKLVFMTLEAAIYDYPPAGLIILSDMKGVGLMHLTRIKLDVIKIFSAYLQEALPVKLKSIHVLNSVYFLDKILLIIKPFVKAEFLEQVNFHKPDLSMADFYNNCISRECLPEDYGGYLPKIDILHEENIKKCLDMKTFFQAEEKQRNKKIIIKI